MKKPIALIFMFFAALAFFSSCKKTTNSPLIGTWTKVNTVGDTVYLTITNNTNLLFGLATGSGNVEQGAGTYTYTTTQLSFTMLSNANGATTNCLGYTATYLYVLGTNQLSLSATADTCGMTTHPVTERAVILNGEWTQI